MLFRTLQSVLVQPVSDRDHVQGPDSAETTLVVYGDYQCPRCAQAFLIIQDIQEHMGDRMRMVFRNYPLTTAHPNAQDAAEAAEAAGAQGKFWQMHRHLLEHQSDLERPALKRYAAELGLDVPRFIHDLEAHSFTPRVFQDFVSGVQWVPTFFLNGVRHETPWDLETLVQAVIGFDGQLQH